MGNIILSPHIPIFIPCSHENVSFDFDALTIQDVLNDYGKRKALGYDNKTVEQCIKDHFEGLFE